MKLAIGLLIFLLATTVSLAAAAVTLGLMFLGWIVWDGFRAKAD